MTGSRPHGWRVFYLMGLFALGTAAQASETLSRDEVRGAAAELAGLLQGSYVLPEIGKRYAAHLRDRATEGAYDGLTGPESLAAAFEDELNALHADAHLRVRTNGSTDNAAPRQRRARGVPQGSALSGARWFADEIAYVAINLLPGDQTSQRAMADFLEEYSGARALILDLRACPGGTLPVMDVLFSHLYKERTHLVTMDTRVEAERRNGAVFSGSPTLTVEAAPDGIARRFHWAMPTSPASSWTNTPVYLLTGSTASACEHLSLALKTSERATLIGTATAGAGHYGGLQDFGDGRFNVFVPVGRTFDPKSGVDWEGTGVAPHIETPAEQALDRALAELGVEREAPTPLENAGDYVGLYGIRQITSEGGKLYLQRVDAQPAQAASRTRRVAPKLELRPVGEDEFEIPRVPGAKVRFERDEAGEIIKLAVQQRDGRWEETQRESGS